jgi:hypothetical protein
VTNKQKPTSDWDYDEFVNWAFQVVFNGLVQGGLKGMRDAVQYQVIQECTRLMNQGGFKSRGK